MEISVRGDVEKQRLSPDNPRGRLQFREAEKFGLPDQKA
jgi:hypothetical protein